MPTKEASKMFIRVTVHRGYNQSLRDVLAPPRATPLGALRRECEERARRRSRPRFGKNIMRSAAEHALQKSPPTAAQVAHIKERRPPDLLMLCASKALARTRGGRTKGRHGNCKMCDKPRSAQWAMRPPHTTQTKKSAGAALVWHISLLAMPEPRPLFLI